MKTRACSWMTVVTAMWMALPLALAGQEGVSPGDRVRVRQSDGTEVTGTLQHVGDGDLRILTRNRTDRLVSVDHIESIERSVGKERHFARNFFVTVLGSAGVSGIIGALTWSPCTETGFLACFLHPDSRTDAAAFGVVVGGAVGIPIGLIVGLAKKGDVWEPVTLAGPDGFALEVTPILSMDRVGFTASIPFTGF